GECAAAALRGDERADHPAGLLPDLGAGRPVVGLDVVGVVELPGHPVAGRIAPADLLETVQREIDVALTAGREDQVGAVGAHGLLAPLANAPRTDDRPAIPLPRRYERAGDAGVAGGALQHAHARLEVAPGLGALEHPEVDAVLEAAAGPEPLDFQIQGGL